MAEHVEEVEYDFEEPRLDVNGFVVDYFAWRIEQDGSEWYDRPELPFGTQPEHEMMRRVAAIFERRHKVELSQMASELTSEETLSYSRYCEMVDLFGRTNDEEDQGMSYGRLVGLISFGGVVASRLSTEEMRREIGQIALYTAKFIDKRIRLSWAKDSRNWKSFVIISTDIIRRDTATLARQQQEQQHCQLVRWSWIGMGTVAAVVAAVLISAKMFSSK